MATTNLMTHFQPRVDVHYDGPYARAVRHLNVSVRALLPRGFFSWHPVRSYIKADLFDAADDIAA